MESTDFFLLQSPVVIRNKIDNWKILNYKQQDWCKKFDRKILVFRQGHKYYQKTPFWEQLCEEKRMTLDDFFKLSEQTNDNWLYFDYKYMKDVFPGNSDLFEEVKWGDIGVSSFTGRESAIWIGNEGAHTPCHMDTYGCNFVAQIFGRKLWILLPPEETDNLEPVRVPYEESSIYSSHNFYTPSKNLLKIKKAYKVILSPGDVLYVPRHWWHYVENLEVAISVNVWIPLEADDESRLEEALVRHYIYNTCHNLPKEEVKEILNPNELGLLSEVSMLETIQICVENCKKLREKGKNKKRKRSEVNVKNNMVDIENLDLKSYINLKSEQYKQGSKNILDVENDKLSLVKVLINSYCHPKNLELIKDTLMGHVSYLKSSS